MPLPQTRTRDPLRAQHAAVIDLSFGDAGKGTTIDWLTAQHLHDADDAAARRAVTIVRFNGGAQAAHNVVTPQGSHHTFAQFGAGTLHATPRRPVMTYLSRFMLLEPFALAAEADALAALGVPDPWALLRVDAAALLTTPYHAAVNQIRELAREVSGEGRHGSCGIGVGHTAEWALDHDAPRVGDIDSPQRLGRRLGELRDWVTDTLADQLATIGARAEELLPPVADLVDAYDAIRGRFTVVEGPWLAGPLNRGRVLFEGAQGVLLDEWRGFHPHTTWSTTTGANISTLLAEAGTAPADLEDPEYVHRLGVLRAYTTRHGAGPMPTDTPGLREALPEPHNGRGQWQGTFRVGAFDTVAHRYALEVAGRIDSLAVTHLDSVTSTNVTCPPTGPRIGFCDQYTLADGSPLDRLLPGPFTDLSYQEKLTALLHQAHAPVTAEPEDPRSTQSWVEAIAARTALPVTVTSTGPTWEDKQSAHRPHCRAR